MRSATIFFQDYIDKLAFICIENRKILVSLSKGKKIWYLPGGKREKGETDVEALKREVKEELSIDLKSETLRKYGVFEAQAHGKPEGTVVKMNCYTGEYTGRIKPSAEIEKAVFVGYIFKPKTSAVDHLIFDDLKGRGWID